MNKSHLLGMLAAILVLPSVATAGADGPIEPAPVYDEVLNQITVREAEWLHDQGVLFYDANTLEQWATGYIPNAIFFGVSDWKALLPEDKSTTMVFYCVNPLCTSSEMAAREVMKLGYTDVRQMPDGIIGWRMTGHKVELP